MNYIFLADGIFSLDSDKTIESISNILNTINDTMYDMVNILSRDPSTMPELWNIIDSAISISQTIALTLVVLYWLTHFIFAIVDMDWKNISIWWYLREIIKLILAKALIDIAPDVCLSIFQFGAWAMQKYMILGSVQEDMFTNLNYDNLKASLDSMSFMEHLFFKMDLFIPNCIMWVCNMAIQLIAYCRLLQVCLMSIVSSIPLATVASSGKNGAAMNFIKDYVAVVGQAAIIILAMIVYKGIISTIIIEDVNGYGAIMKLCLSTMVLTVTIFGSQKLARTFLGN